MSQPFDRMLREEGRQRTARLVTRARRTDGKGPMNEPLRPAKDTPSRARPHLRERVAALEAEVAELKRFVGFPLP